MEGNDNYLVFSYLGSKTFKFKEEAEARSFFELFIGKGILLSNNKLLEMKDDIQSFEDLVHAAIFLQHGITKDGNNIILRQYLQHPSEKTIDIYQTATDLFCEPGKGLALFGNSGVGKTTIMRFLNMAAESNYIKGKQFSKISVKKIISLFKTSGFDVFDELKLNECHGENICMDDIGRDKGMRIQYGDKINIIGDIIESRYDSYIDKGLITHFTSNYGEEELRAMYDEPRRPVIWSRICEMTNFFVVEGKNFRMPE